MRPWITGVRRPQGAQWPRALHRARLDAAATEIGTGSYFFQDSAAVLHGLPLWGADLDRVHVVRLLGGHGEVTPLLRAYRRPQVLPPLEVVGGLRATSLERTASDLMRKYAFGPALAVADAALRALNRNLK